MSNYGASDEDFFNDINRRDLSNFDIEKTPWLFFQSNHQDFNSAVNNTYTGNQDYQHSNKVAFGNTAGSKLSAIFFSEKNMKTIQKMLIKYVFDKTDGAYLIEEQDPEALMLWMKADFQNKSLNMPDNIDYQIRRLNWLVVDDIGPGVISAIMQNIGYLRDKFSAIKPLDLPIYESSAGTKTIPSFYK